MIGSEIYARVICDSIKAVIKKKGINRILKVESRSIRDSMVRSIDRGNF